MHLISALASGIRGGENGLATIYNRGTTTSALLYSSAEGDSYAGSVSLDSNGSAVVYVNGSVDVIVKDSSGTIVREFTDMVASGNVEVRSSGFSGTDYVTGISAAGNPTDLNSVMDLWKTSAGTTDYKVLLNGVATPLQSAFGAFTGVSISVKDPAYGAVGDGVTDDTAAIQNAITAVDTNGGGNVFFPVGTYKVSGALSTPSGVAVVGVSNSLSIISMSDGSANMFECSEAGSYVFDRIQLTHSVPNSGTLIQPHSGGGSKILVNYSVVGSTSNTTYCVGNASAYAAEVTFYATVMNLGLTTGSAAIVAATTSGKLAMAFVTIVPPNSYASSMISGGVISAQSVVFKTTGKTLGTCFGFDATAAAGSLISNSCEFQDPTSGTFTAQRYASVSSLSDWVCSGNYFGASVVPYSYTAAAAATQVRLYSRETVTKDYGEDNSAAITIASDLYGAAWIERTANTAQTLTLTKAPLGSKFVLHVWANGTALTTGVPVLTNVTGFIASNISSGNYSTFTFVSSNFGGGITWIPCGVVEDY